MRYVIIAVLFGVLAAVSGCGGKDVSNQRGGNAPPSTPSPSTGPKQTSGLPDNLIVKKAPEGAKDISTALKEAKGGEDVVIRGRVGGMEEVFMKDRATMMMMDLSMKSCDMIPGDACKTPWDYCCDDEDTKRKNRATIQVVDTNGKILNTTLQGSVSELDVIVVKGKVVKIDAANFIINANEIFIEEKFKKG
ncbi:MAG TPA: hypothetical protein VEJ63_20830 [Planctomycetota bacterium]|nr:hypothetical protein [Planctomycetota bacterium]